MLNEHEGGIRPLPSAEGSGLGPDPGSYTYGGAHGQRLSLSTILGQYPAQTPQHFHSWQCFRASRLPLLLFSFL